MAIKMSQGLKLKQTQGLVMTPQLQQAIKLLTLGHMEMTDIISKELVENPILEEVSIDIHEKKTEEDYKLESLEGQSAEVNPDSFNEAPIIKSENDDFDWQTYVDLYNNHSSTPSSTVKTDGDDLPNYENMVSKGESLADHLEWQLRMEDLSDIEIDFGRQIIHNINDDGYLSTSFEDILSGCEISEERAKDILEMIQRFEPVGCGAEGLVDCLLAQARISEERSPLLEKIIREHLDDLKNRDFKKIAGQLGVSIENIQETSALLQNFHPKPGRLFGGAETQYIVPDIYIVKVGNEFVVRVNEDGIPRLKISSLYRSLIDHQGSDKEKEASEYVQEKLKSAMWLIKSLQNRQRTIEKVSKSIVKRQQDFFKKGPRYLKPMILKDVANEIGMHESTVSRVTSNKYMHTPIGMFELKYFFNTGLGGKNGGVDVAGEVLKLKIKEMLENENPRRPLSDQKIAELLGRDGVQIARRTVAKYRETLGILSTSKRKVI